ncbi:tape measure [Caudoviricetes sp.]|nr:tape measure [Caudoviricetes sp.]
MAISQADVLAIRATMLNVARVRSDVQTIRRDLQQLRSENLRAANSQRTVASAVSRTYDAASRSGARAISQTRALERETQRLRGTYSSLRGLVASIGIPFGAAGAARLGLLAIQKFEGKAGAQRAFAFNFGKDLSRSVMGELNAFADRQGLSRTSTRRTGLSIAGSGNVSPGELTPIIRAFSALAAVGGANSEQTNRAFEQLAQIASQGKLQGDELRQIAENLVPLRTLIIRAGLGDRLGSQTNPITFREVVDVLLKFGQSGNVAEMLAAQAQNATSSLQRFYNIVEDELAPALGDALTPAVREAADMATEWSKAIDPEEVKLRTRQFLGFVKTIVDNGPALAGIYLGMKAYQALLSGRYYFSTIGAANALDYLASSAYAAAGAGGGVGGGGSAGGRGSRGSRGGGGNVFVGGGSMGGGGGSSALPRASSSYSGASGYLIGPNGRRTYFRGGSSAGGSKLRNAAGSIGRGLGGAARGVGTIGGGVAGGLAGQKVGEAVSDNPFVQLLFALGGSLGGSWLAGKGIAALGSSAASGGLAAGGMAAAGATGIGVILGELALLGIAGTEAMDGKLGTENSFFTRWFLNGNGAGDFWGGFNPGNRAAWDKKQAGIESQRAAIMKVNSARQNAKRFLGQRMPWLRGKNGGVGMNDVLQYSWMLPVEMQKALFSILTPDQRSAWSRMHGGASTPGASPRAAAYDSRSAEQDTRSIRWTM